MDSPLAASPAAHSRHSGKPIRLIDLNATISKRDRGNICFKAAEDWDFHVISHTWSLGVRNLSEKIGKQISTQLSAACGRQEEEDKFADAYNDAFEQADFSCDPCYQQLIDFFQLLAGEAVEQIWFDALCINQTDEDEKSKEIANMAMYYSQTKGCYVLTHGVGEGYQLLGKSGQVEVSLPRWFTRAWTYQEFLLPKRLSFIVEGLDEEFVGFIKQLIRKNCLCSCYRKIPWAELNAPVWIEQAFLVEKWFWGPSIVHKEKLLNEGRTQNEQKPEKRKQMTMGPEKIDQDPNDILSMCSRCAECHSLPLIRKAPLSSYLGQPPQCIFFVDREVYLEVMESHCFKRSNASVPDERYPAYRPPPWGDKRNAALQPLGKLFGSLSKKVLTPLELIEEVGHRHCTNEEDRVLCILGLLRVELTQLRTGKGLAMQIAELARFCSLEMLIELCGMDEVAHCTIGMSWAPNFVNSTSHSFWRVHVLPELQKWQLEVAVERQQVCADGSIKLLAKVVSGHLLAITALPAAIREMSQTTTAKYRQSYPHLTDTEQPTHFIVVPILNTDNTIPSESDIAYPASRSSLLRQNMSLESCCFIPLDLYAAKSDQSTLILKFLFNWQTGSSHGGSLHIPIELAQVHTDFTSLTDLVVSFPIQMVLLGGAPTNCRDGSRFNVIMVCLSKEAAADGEGEEQLHKVGMLYLTQSQEWGMQMKLFEEASMSECLIGGFGADLSHYVSLEHDVTGEVCILDRPPRGYAPIRKSW